MFFSLPFLVFDLETLFLVGVYSDLVGTKVTFLNAYGSESWPVTFLADCTPFLAEKGRLIGKAASRLARLRIRWG